MCSADPSTQPWLRRPCRSPPAPFPRVPLASTRRRPIVPTARNATPTPTNHGRTFGTPVAARVALDAAAVPVLPVVDDPPDVGVAVDTGVAADGVVVDVVSDAGVVVEVVVDPPAAAAVNFTDTVSAARPMLSIVSFAAYVTDSAVVSLTAKVAIPPLFVVALVAVTFDDPAAASSATVFPATGSPLPPS